MNKIEDEIDRLYTKYYHLGANLEVDRQAMGNSNYSLSQEELDYYNELCGRVEELEWLESLLFKQTISDKEHLRMLVAILKARLEYYITVDRGTSRGLGGSIKILEGVLGDLKELYDTILFGVESCERPNEKREIIVTAGGKHV